MHQSAGYKRVPPMVAKEAHDTLFPLQPRNINIQVHPVDSFHFQGDVLRQHLGNTSWYAHFGSGTTPILRDRLPLRRPKPLGENCLQFSTVDRSHLSDYERCSSASEIHLVGLTRSLAREYAAHSFGEFSVDIGLDGTHFGARPAGTTWL